MKVAWRAAAVPLPPAAVAASDEAGDRLRERATKNASVWRAEEWTVVMAVAEELPWADGATYLGMAHDANGLLLPVHYCPDVPADLLLLAVRELCAPSPGPYAVLPGVAGVVVVPLDPA